jgi:hypothetical protein
MALLHTKCKSLSCREVAEFAGSAGSTWNVSALREVSGARAAPRARDRWSLLDKYAEEVVQIIPLAGAMGQEENMT